jgi:hypothetical protein
MTVRYHQRGGRRSVPEYVCQRAGIAYAQPPCQRIPGAALDRAVAALLLKMVTPQAMALIVALQGEVVQRVEEAQRLRHLQVERAQYEADLAQRRSLRVDPDNCLVAGWSSVAVKWEGARDVGEERGQRGRWGGARPASPIELQPCPRAEPRPHPTQRRVPHDAFPGGDCLWWW